MTSPLSQEARVELVRIARAGLSRAPGCAPPIDAANGAFDLLIETLGILTEERDAAMAALSSLAEGAGRLREALTNTRLELRCCADQLRALGRPGHPDDSVSRALKAADAALLDMEGA